MNIANSLNIHQSVFVGSRHSHEYVVGILQSRETMITCSVWRSWSSVLCGWEGQFESDNPFHNGDKSNLSPVQLPGFACFGTASLPQSAVQVSLQIGRGHDAPPASRLNAQTSRFPICWGPFLRPSDPACRCPCNAAVVSLGGGFPALILHTGDPLESDHQPFSQHAAYRVFIFFRESHMVVIVLFYISLSQCYVTHCRH